MTKEELEKEADNWCFRKKYTRGYSYIYAQIRDAYICGAEPREKRIGDLEAINKRISDECHKLVDSLEKKQNENVDLIGKIAFTENALNNTKAVIERMKNWCNCKNYQQCLIELAEQGKGMKPSECCRNCKKWEIKEK